jgi:hypothetical protein
MDESMSSTIPKRSRKRKRNKASGSKSNQNESKEIISPDEKVIEPTENNQSDLANDRTVYIEGLPFDSTEVYLMIYCTHSASYYLIICPLN